MAEQGLFRLGAELRCPTCLMTSWIALDTLRQSVTCELCGSAFDATRQLVNGEWHYRRSGILGTEKNAQGAIPVALTLQQLATNIGSILADALYSTSLDLEPLPTSVNRSCELDFVWVISRPHRQRTAIILGECKDRGPLNIDDFQRAIGGLRQVALSLPRDRFKSFVLLSKLAPFTADEVSAARILNDEHHLRAILLTDQELEPYHLYERRTTANERTRHANSPEDMAWATFQQYFRPLGDSAAIGMPA